MTVNGAMAQALSTAVSGENACQTQATSTAKTSFAGVSVQSTAAFVGRFFLGYGDDRCNRAGRHGRPSPLPETPSRWRPQCPTRAYATALIGGASDVADALLGPDDKIFGTAILGRNGGIGDSSTFDFSFRGDLILGEVDDDRVDNLGFIFGTHLI